MQRDSLDFRRLSLGKLFTRQLFPTIMGMAATALFTVGTEYSSATAPKATRCPYCSFFSYLYG